MEMDWGFGRGEPYVPARRRPRRATQQQRRWRAGRPSATGGGRRLRGEARVRRTAAAKRDRERGGGGATYLSGGGRREASVGRSGSGELVTGESVVVFVSCRAASARRRRGPQRYRRTARGGSGSISWWEGPRVVVSCLSERICTWWCGLTWPSGPCFFCLVGRTSTRVVEIVKKPELGVDNRNT